MFSPITVEASGIDDSVTVYKKSYQSALSARKTPVLELK
jgi:hypothetical protein